MSGRLAVVKRPTVLLTLGRLPKSYELVRCFSQAGYRVLVAEPHPWHLCRVSSRVSRSYQVVSPVVDAPAYLADMLRIVRDEGVDLVVPVSEETMHAAALKPLLPAHARLYCPDQSRLIALHDKHRFITMALDAGLAVPRTFEFGSDAARELAAQHAVVVKPRFSCSGRGVELFERGATLPARGEPSVVQERLFGQVLSTFSVVSGGTPLVTSVYCGRVMSGTVSVCFERIEHPKIDAWVASFAKFWNYDGFLSFDFVVDAAGVPQAIECNPRVTSGVHFIRPEALGKAILTGVASPDSEESPFRENRWAQQFYPTLTETERSLLTGGPFAKNFRAMLRARDVVWEPRDPLPFLTMTMTSWRILSHAIRKKTSLGEAATWDIEWSPEAS
ncbi:MAG: ATP-grasp domain-containing protein [Myxococcales bacterium]|nr:ATP-grasp domain-containing protein [Myxococcales bacterium]MDP3503742.1 ATP-grasp domain-containing protein [Myxococcales bacterium]